MSPDERPEWLPSGWTMEVKNSAGHKHKCYLNPSGLKFYSKPEVSRYLESMKNNTASEKSCHAEESTGDASLKPDVSHKNETPGLLPQGDKSSSEPDMSLNSEAADVGCNISKEKREGFGKVVSRTEAEGLPPGWIKEVRVRKNSVPRKKDPYYIDPSSGYIFLSKLDALRYLDTGDIGSCATKPRKRDIGENEKKPGNSTTRRQLFEGDVLQEKTREKLAKRSEWGSKSKKSPATPPGRSSKRLKGVKPEGKSDPSLNNQADQTQSEQQPETETNEGKDELEESAVEGKQVNVEKPTKEEKPEPQPSNRHGDSNRKDLCLDFAHTTLAGEMPFEVPSISSSLQQERVEMEAARKIVP